MIFRAQDISVKGTNLVNIQKFEYIKRNHPNRYIYLEPDDPKRSNKQNSLYWKYLEMIEYDTGSSANDLHEYARRAFLTPKTIKIYDKGNKIYKEYEIPKSTTELTKVEFGDYMTKISVWSGIEIPDTEVYRKMINSAPLK